MASKLVQFICDDGQPILINPAFVTSVTRARESTKDTVIHVKQGMAGMMCIVAEDFHSVAKKLGAVR